MMNLTRSCVDTILRSPCNCPVQGLRHRRSGDFKPRTTRLLGLGSCPPENLQLVDFTGINLDFILYHKILWEDEDEAAPMVREAQALCTPCPPTHESAARVLPSLSRVARPGVSEPSLTLLDFRQWSCLPSFPCPSRTRAPSLHQRYPASSVLRAPPPPCWPGPPLTKPRFSSCRPPAGLPVLRLPSSSMHASARTPAGAARCPRRSLPSPPPAFPCNP